VPSPLGSHRAGAPDAPLALQAIADAGPLPKPPVSVRLARNVSPCWTPTPVWAAFSPDSAVLATGGLDGTVRLFDVANGQALGALPSASGSTAVPMFLPGDVGLVAGQDDGTTTLWDLRPAALARRACEIAGRRLTHAEWDAALAGRAYAPAC
jgi:hypothetical protein